MSQALEYARMLMRSAIVISSTSRRLNGSDARRVGDSMRRNMHVVLQGKQVGRRPLRKWRRKLTGSIKNHSIRSQKPNREQRIVGAEARSKSRSFISMPRKFLPGRGHRCVLHQSRHSHRKVFISAAEAKGPWEEDRGMEEIGRKSWRKAWLWE